MVAIATYVCLVTSVITDHEFLIAIASILKAHAAEHINGIWPFSL